MLYTNLKHIEKVIDQNRVLEQNENVVIICGRMEKDSITVYRIAEELEKQFPQVKFFDMEFDNPESTALKNTIEYYNITHIPIIGFFKSGNLVNVLFGTHTYQEIADELKKEYSIIN